MRRQPTILRLLSHPSALGPLAVTVRFDMFVEPECVDQTGYESNHKCDQHGHKIPFTPCGRLLVDLLGGPEADDQRHWHDTPDTRNMAMCGCAFIRLVYRFCRTVRRANQLGGTLFYPPRLNKSLRHSLWLFVGFLILSSEVPRIVLVGTIGPLGHDLFELEFAHRTKQLPIGGLARSLRLSDNSSNPKYELRAALHSIFTGLSSTRVIAL